MFAAEIVYLEFFVHRTPLQCLVEWCCGMGWTGHCTSSLKPAFTSEPFGLVGGEFCAVEKEVGLKLSFNALADGANACFFDPAKNKGRRSTVDFADVDLAHVAKSTEDVLAKVAKTMDEYGFGIGFRDGDCRCARH